MKKSFPLDRIVINRTPENTPREVSKSSAGANKSGEIEIFVAKQKQQEQERPSEVEKWKTREI